MNPVFPLSIAQVSDMHLFADENEQLLGMPTTLSFQATIRRLKKLRSELDLLLLTGDLSGDGSLESYEMLQNLLRPLEISTYWLPGNHDNAIAMEQILNLRLVSRRKSFERGGWHFILLDSTVPECVHGHLSAKILHWLDFQLSMGDNKPTLLALHHPPFKVDSKWLDSSTLQNSQDLFAIVDRHPQVKLVLFGHIHQEFHCQRHSVDYLGTPSTCIQFAPSSSKFSLDQKSPGFRLLRLYSNGTWESSVERVPFSYKLDLAATGY
ncbi:3',5'-cyclic-nucleotide phosphodiesterase [Scytonema hofmannii PCC 7110]|uniref:3',5'-cyclic-nucleotide phosphodiesterase n=1 Tax=Scytonema hofmannii PCC 7110 TaxID=128403 RepID=A0A139X8B0_9CYAN|nr:3',5'-cyclic-AMP phosphodiesterase [Scytonema hofmannii]KYC40934.1 3',5'-cyclic-nucleotide phosphodiesterase [Scytonema hofmannii PCC 7110]